MHWPTWTAALSTLVSLIALAMAGLAVIGKKGLQSREEFEKLSEARAERIEWLEGEQRRSVAAAEVKHASYESQIDMLTIRIEALTGTVAQLERNEADSAKRNIELQRLLDVSHEQVRSLSEQVAGRLRSLPKKPRD